jgi:hypothetical protein
MQNLHKFLRDKLWEFFSALPVFALGLMQFPADHVNSTIGTAFIWESRALTITWSWPLVKWSIVLSVNHFGSLKQQIADFESP